ncbi:hypothetical protein BCR43DRAFT_512860 [Syncephalastrum racemosum]|uniref:Uncharacterized protein n=1 Tax=Syncephalastrum racemosum TaxID=13706 RepID=A0A1X2HHU8_SYNRA|nr:hypothetical protein BCR43DRAFT_512860 [Syncephalastrum racemosum]
MNQNLLSLADQHRRTHDTVRQLEQLQQLQQPDHLPRRAEPDDGRPNLRSTIIKCPRGPDQKKEKIRKCHVRELVNEYRDSADLRDVDGIMGCISCAAQIAVGSLASRNGAYSNVRWAQIPPEEHPRTLARQLLFGPYAQADVASDDLFSRQPSHCTGSLGPSADTMIPASTSLPLQGAGWTRTISSLGSDDNEMTDPSLGVNSPALTTQPLVVSAFGNTTNDSQRTQRDTARVGSSAGNSSTSGGEGDNSISKIDNRDRFGHKQLPRPKEVFLWN